jgi:hypothetical protein
MSRAPRERGPLAAVAAPGHNGRRRLDPHETAAVKFSRDPEPETVQSPRGKGRRFWLLLIGVPLGFVTLALLGWVISAQSGLSTAVAEADTTDPGWRLEDIEAKRIKPLDTENAALVIAQIKQTPLSGAFNNRLDDYLQHLDPPKLLNEQQQGAVKNGLTFHGPQLALARSLRDKPHGRHDIAWAANSFATLLKCQDNRTAAQGLRYDILDRCQAGDIDGAIASCIACFHAGSSIGDEPTTISMLVRIAVQAVAVGLIERTLAQGEPSPGILAELQQRLEAEEPAPLLLFATRGERAMSNHFFDNLRTANLGPNPITGAVGGGGAGTAVLDWLAMLPGFVSSQQSGCLRLTNKVVEIARQPPETWAPQFNQIRAEIPNLPILARLLAPAIDKVADACRRNHAILRCTIVAVAMERYRKEKGRWPETIAEVVTAGYLKAVPTDPFDGKPIRLKRTDDGWLVWATGTDQIDHGGTLDRQKMYQAGNDIGVQLWDVAARRQPAPPPKPSDTEEFPDPAPPPAAPPPPPDKP